MVVATYEGVINPVAASYLHYARSLSACEYVVCSGLDLEALTRLEDLDTSMRLIIKDITSATVPVIVFVSPSGGSAGVGRKSLRHGGAYRCYGTWNQYRRRTPSRNGGGMDSAMKDKEENDAAAYRRSLAEQRKRNASWAEEAVRKTPPPRSRKH